MKKIILVIIYYCFFVSTIVPQSNLERGNQFIINYTPKEYGANQQIWNINQDEKGILYFGNQKGLLEFDGVGWRVYPIPNKSVVRSIAISKDGKIYVGAQGDLGYFQADSLGRLIFHSLIEFVPKDKRNFSDVWNTFVSNGKVYFNVAKYILIWDIQNKEFKVIQSKSAYHIMFMVNGLLYVREFGKGLEILKNDSLALVKEGEKFADERIYVMLPFPGDDGSILIATRTMGLFKYDGNNFVPFKTEADEFIKENLIYYPGAVLSDGNIILGTVNGGAIVIDHKGKEVRKYNTTNGIIDNTIYFTFQDHAGAIWLATSNGISRIDYESPVSYFDSRNDFKTLSNDIIRYNGIIYVATNSGVYYLDSKTSKFHILKNSNNQSFVFLKFGKELLVGTFNGLFKVDNDKLLPIRKSVSNEYVVHALRLSKLNSNRIYVGTYGLWSIIKENNRWIDEGQILNIADVVNSIVEDDDGKLWLGTNSSGLFRIEFNKDDKGNIILDKPVIGHFDKTNGLPSGQLWVDKFNGVNYFSSSDSLYKFEQSRKMFSTDTSDKIISALAYITDHKGPTLIQQDSLGRMWVGTENKLAMGTPQLDGSYRWLSSPFKRFSDEQINKVYVENKDDAWFLAANSIIRFDFTKKNLNNTNFSTLVRNVKIGTDSIIYFGESISNPMIPEISYNNNSIKFRYSATSYEGKNSNLFKTLLEGFDKNWSSWSMENTKEYTNLPPGQYTFKVVAKNMIDIESNEAYYSFEILSPWYRTWWAYIFYVLLLASGIFLVDRVQRHRLIAKENEKLKMQTALHRAETAELQAQATEAQSRLIEAENERKTKELEEAHQLQLSMLPESVPKVQGLDIAVYMQTATEVGGDYYDFRTAPDGTLSVALGDATGHGMQAGTLVTIMKGIFSIEADVNEVLPFFQKSVQAIKEIKLGRLMMAFAFLKIKGTQLSLSNAGVPPVYIYRKNQNEVEEIDNKGMPLGAMSDFPYKETKTELNNGDVIFLLSDGFPELSNNNKEAYGYDRVKKTFKEIGGNSAEEIVESLKSVVNTWSGGKEPDDDVTFVVIKIK
jgi:serine phosphatase RsbU (regulator of sigma subunit)/ligand-binding sensor domain-containing protein